MLITQPAIRPIQIRRVLPLQPTPQPPPNHQVRFIKRVLGAGLPTYLLLAVRKTALPLRASTRPVAQHSPRRVLFPVAVRHDSTGSLLPERRAFVALLTKRTIDFAGGLPPSLGSLSGLFSHFDFIRYIPMSTGYFIASAFLLSVSRSRFVRC